MGNYDEFVCEFHDGERDWVDPVVSIEESDTTIKVKNSISSNYYEYSKAGIKKWCVRPYSEETTYDPINEGGKS